VELPRKSTPLHFVTTHVICDAKQAVLLEHANLSGPEEICCVKVKIIIADVQRKQRNVKPPKVVVIESTRNILYPTIL
jgi:hypothetical protein